MAAGGGKRGGEHNNQPKEGRAGRRAPYRKDDNGTEGGGDYGEEGNGGGVCCGEVRGKGGHDDDDNDDFCGDAGGGFGDGDSRGMDDGGNDCSKCHGDSIEDSGCRGDGDGLLWLLLGKLHWPCGGGDRGVDNGRESGGKVRAVAKVDIKTMFSTNHFLIV